MEWLVVLAVLACSLGMLAMGAIAWAVGKRTARGSETTEAAKPRFDGSAPESAIGSA